MLCYLCSSQAEVSRPYHRAHAFILPSIVTEAGDEEGQSVVLAEAQASGLPVIATAVGGIPEGLSDGHSGLLVPPKDPEALSCAILKLAHNPETWGRMGREGRILVEAHFDLEKLNDQLVSIYGTFVGKGTGSFGCEGTP